jgi:hypothetical protein
MTSERGPESDYGRPLPSALEELVSRWREVATDLQLDLEEHRTADALAHLVDELAKNERPDRRLVRAAVCWFKGRLDMSSDEFALTSEASITNAVPHATSPIVTQRILDLSALLDTVFTMCPE